MANSHIKCYDSTGQMGWDVIKRLMTIPSPSWSVFECLSEICTKFTDASLTSWIWSSCATTLQLFWTSSSIQKIRKRLWWRQHKKELPHEVKNKLLGVCWLSCIVSRKFYIMHWTCAILRWKVFGIIRKCSTLQCWRSAGEM